MISLEAAQQIQLLVNDSLIFTEEAMSRMRLCEVER